MGTKKETMAAFATKKATVQTVQSEAAQEQDVSTTKSLLDRVSNELETLNLRSHVEVQL